jgi:WD40 repeat protein
MLQAARPFLPSLFALFVFSAPARSDEPEELPLEVVHTFKALVGEVNYIAVSADEKVIAFGSRNSDTVFLWDIETGKERTRIRLDHTVDGMCVAFSADGKTLYWREAFLFPCVIRAFDTSNGKMLRAFAFAPPGGVVNTGYGSSFSADGKYFAFANAQTRKGVSLWNVETGKPIHEFAHEMACSCAFSPDGKLLATQDEYGQVRVWDLRGKKLHEFDRPAKPRGPGGITLLTFSPDSKKVAACGWFRDDTAILVWDLDKGKQIQKIETKLPGSGPASALVFTPHGKWIGMSTRGGVSLDLRFWDVESGNPAGFVAAGNGRLGGGFAEKSVMFTPKGTYLSGGGMGEVRLYAAKKGHEKDPLFVVPGFIEKKKD